MEAAASATVIPQGSHPPVPPPSAPVGLRRRNILRRLWVQGLLACLRPRSGARWGFWPRTAPDLQPWKKETIIKAMRSVFVILAGVLLVGAVGGCGSSRSTLPGVELVDRTDVVEFEGLRPEKAGYVLGTGDQLDISFLFEPHLSSRVKVRPDGGVALPIVGDLVVAGKTPSELDSLLTAAYSTYYRDPELTVNVTDFAPPTVYVMGEVARPSDVPLRPGMTALQALAAVSGPRPEGNLSSVILLRRTGPGKAIAERMDLSRVLKGKGRSYDLLLAPNDIIYVPPTFIAKVDRFVDQFFYKMQPVPVLYLRGWEAFHTNDVYDTYQRTQLR